MTGVPVDDGVTLDSFEVPSTLGNERKVMERVTAALADTDLSEEKLRSLETAVSEAAMNAIEHGNQLDPDVPVEVSVEASKRYVTVSVSDRGDPGPIAVPEPDLEAKLAGEQSPRGWGLFLIRAMVDDVRSKDEGGRHTVELIMDLGRPSVMQGQALTTGRRPHGQTTVIDLSGDIDRNAGETMDEAYASAGSGPLVLNFANVGFINSSGIALIISFLTKARQDGRSVAACGLTPHYEEIFSVTRLSDFMTVYSDEEAAAASAAE